MWSIRKIHKYIAIVLGFVFLVWIVSGTMMVLPKPTPKAIKTGPMQPFDVSAATLSPADAIARLEENLGQDLEVSGIKVIPLPDRIAYEVRARRQRPALVDAGTGDLVIVTQDMAARIAREHVREDVGESAVELIESHSPTYPWGALPVYRVAFEAGQGTIVYVGQADASVTVTDLRQQLWALLISVHDFGIVRALFGIQSLHTPLLLLAAAASLVLVVTGYYMVFVTPARRRRKAKRRAAP